MMKFDKKCKCIKDYYYDGVLLYKSSEQHINYTIRDNYIINVQHEDHFCQFSGINTSHEDEYDYFFNFFIDVKDERKQKLQKIQKIK